MISNKYLHNYNMRNNPDYKREYQQRNDDNVERNQLEDKKYHRDDYSNYFQDDDFGDIDNDFKNDNQLNPIKRPMPTDFNNLKTTPPTNKRYYTPREHLRQYDVKFEDNQVRDYPRDYRDSTKPSASRDKSYLGNAYKKFRHYDNARVLRNVQSYQQDRNNDVHADLVNKNNFDNSGFGPSFTTEFFDSLDLHREEFKLNIKIFRILVWEKTVELRSRYGFS